MTVRIRVSGSSETKTYGKGVAMREHKELETLPRIQLLSGHASKHSLEIYQHLSLEAVEEAYQQAVKLLAVSETWRPRSRPRGVPW